MTKVQITLVTLVTLVSLVTLVTFFYICSKSIMMVNRPVLIISTITLMLLVSCRATRVTVTPGRMYSDAGSYIENFKDLAISEMKRTGVPASITLAQGIIESDMGRSRLAAEGNNHFGIKCHDDWTGPVVRHTDDRRNECFRKYGRPEESYKDHSDFLKSEPRYKSLFALGTSDYKAWARGLKKAGYATNPDYANMLIRKIEEYNLDKYDTGVPVYATDIDKKDTVSEKPAAISSVSTVKNGKMPAGNNSVQAVRPRIMERNRIQYIIVRENDTPESLEKEFQLLKWELTRYNELQPGFRCTNGQILYLQPKMEKAEYGKDFHTVSEGETMYSISQIYGIKLKSLLNMNRMTEGQEAVAGQKIWLRSVKPVE
jgi:hypothetical protein